MIRLTRLDGSEVVVNCDLLESVERTPDTVITLTTGRKLVVRESVTEVVARAVEYKRQLGFCPLIRERLTPGHADVAAWQGADRDGGTK